MAGSVRYRSLQISPDVVLSGKTAAASSNSTTSNTSGNSTPHTAFAAESPLAGTVATPAAITNGKQLFVVAKSRSPSGSPNQHINTHINNRLKSPRSSPNNNSHNNHNNNSLRGRKNPYAFFPRHAASTSSSLLSRGVYTLLCLSLVVTVGLLHASIRSTAEDKNGILDDNPHPAAGLDKNSSNYAREPYEVNQVLNLRQSAAASALDRTTRQPQQLQPLQPVQPQRQPIENNNKIHPIHPIHPLLRRDDSVIVVRSTKKRHPPRVLYLDGPWVDPTNNAPRQILLLDSDSQDAALRMAAAVPDDWQPPHHGDNNNDNGEQPQCVPKASWQTRSYPNCNSIHEIHVASAMAAAAQEQQHAAAPHNAEETLSVLGEGWFRTTWQWDRETPTTNNKESVVLKTLRIPREFLAEYYELHRRDAVAMERLTASPFVVNIFGYCGQSAINELANFPYPGIQNLETFNRRMRGQEHSVRVNEMKLRLSASIALGLADIHAGGSPATDDEGDDDDDEQVFMAHYDLNPRNIAMFAGGRPKINDFNIAEFLYYNPRTNETCPFPSRLHEPWWRAPEEMNTTHTAMVNEKVDVYALGNVLYHTLTTHSARGKQHKERMDQVRPQVAANVRPEIPAVFRNSTDPSVVAMLQAMDLCWQTNPAERGTAEQVAAILYDALLKISPALRKEIDDQETNPEEGVVVPPVSGAGVAEDDDARVGTMEDKNALGERDVVVAAAAAT